MAMTTTTTTAAASLAFAQGGGPQAKFTASMII